MPDTPRSSRFRLTSVEPIKHLRHSHGVDFQGARWTAVWLTLLTVGAALLRLLYLTGEGLTADEGFSVFLARTTPDSFRHIAWQAEFNMVLYYEVLRAWAHLGRSEFLIRLLSVLFAAATVPVVYFLGARLFNRSTGLIACLLLAIHPAHVMLSQRARSYPLVILLVALSSFFFLRLLERPTGRNSAAYAVLSAAAVYSHIFAVLVIVAQLLSLIFVRTKPLPFRALLISLVLMTALLTPMGIFLIHNRAGGQVGWVADLSVQQALSVLYSLTLSRERSLFYVLLWAAGIWGGVKTHAEDTQWSYWFVAIWLFVPPVITAAVSVVKPVLMARFLAVCLPASMLLAAAGLHQLAHWSRVVALVLLLLIIFHSATAIRSYIRTLRTGENWRGATAYLLTRVADGDLVVMEPYRRHTFDYYREIRGGISPTFAAADSLSAPLPKPFPKHVWYLASVFFNPYWKGDKPGAAENEVRSFLAAHRQSYCSVTLYTAFSPVDLWRFTRCGDSP